MKKTSKWFAAIVTAAMGFAALPAHAAGDIYEIRPFKRNTALVPMHEYVPCVDADRKNVPYTTAEKPLAAGEELYFNVRLVARVGEDTSVKAGEFRLTYRGSSSAELDWFLNAPKIGIYVGGVLKYATMVQGPTIMPYNYDRDIGDTLHLYDMVFKYTVEPGDLGLPIRLALRNGKPATSEYDERSELPQEYLMQNVGMFVDSDPWRIEYYDDGATEPSATRVEFTFNKDRQSPDYKLKDGSSETESPMQADCLFSNNTLSQCGFYVKTVDFDRDEKRTPGWKTVRRNRTNQTSVEILDGEIFATNAIPKTTLYVWAVDPAWLSNPSAATWVDPAVTPPPPEDGGTTGTITIGYDGNNNPVTAIVPMATATIREKTLYANFSVKGITATESGKTATLIMSSSKDFSYNSAVGYTLNRDFITCDVTCIEGEPELALTLTEATDVYTVTDEYTKTLTQMKLTLTDAYTDNIVVTIRPTLDETQVATPSGYKVSDVIRLSDKADPREGWTKEGELKITIPKGSTASYPVYVYGMGASANQNTWVAGLGQKVTFALTPDKGGEFIKKTTTVPIYVKPADPVVANKTQLETEGISGGDMLSVTIRDNFTDVNDTETGYVVKAMWWNEGEEPPKDPKFKTEAFNLAASDGTTTFKPDGDGILTELKDGLMVADELPLIPTDVRGDYLRLRITAPNTAKTTFVDVKVTKKPHAFAYAYEALTGDEKPDSFNEIDADGEATLAYVGVNLETPNKSGGKLYAYLKLKDPTQADLVSSRYIITDGSAAKGICINPDKSVEVSRAKVELKDGIQDGTTLQFDVVLCTTEPYDATKDYTGYDVTTPLEILVDNVVPRVNNISMSGWPLDETGVRFEGEATKDVNQYFTFDISDAKRDLEATGNDAFKIQYRFKGCGPQRYSTNTTYQGDPSKLIVTNKFTEVGEAKMIVQLTDKDGGKTKELTYSFAVVDKPSITIANKDGLTAFNENESPEFKVTLSNNRAEEGLTVKLTVKPLRTDDKKGAITLGGDFTSAVGDTYTCTYGQGVTEHSFVVTDADGTAAAASKFSITAEVTTETFVPDTQTTWSEYYSHGILSPLEVKNVKPTMTIDGQLCRAAQDQGVESDAIIYLNSSNAPIQVAVGDGDKITWSVDDVKIDLEKGIKMTIINGDGTRTVETTTDATDHDFTPHFTSAGPKTVQFTATDKDGASITAVRFYQVKSERQLNVTAVGPSQNGNSSPHASHYRGAGRGQGHVFVTNPAKLTDGKSFSFDYNCGLSLSVKASAQGYRVDDIDDGSLTKNGSLGDVKIDQEGNVTTGAPYFEYQGDRDSFFYVWVRDNLGDDGKFTSEIYGDVAPEITQAVPATIQLPREADDEGQYETTLFEAIFSKEFLSTDNIGDINADSIPDIYALGYTGFGVTAEKGNDMESLRDYNNDGDYFPFVFDQVQGTYIFLPSNSWTGATKKFTATLEIRGWDEHLNDAYQVLVKQGYAGQIPEYAATRDEKTTFSALEYDAWVQAGKDPEWSPERPTDPTKADTDGDGMPDGYEYYIWYKAHVGWMENGEHKYLTGRKYNPADPYNPIEITSEEIAREFDPLTRSGSDWDRRDTDDDGLSDYAEYLLGTNPFDYDTDNDGLPDCYEVVFTGTNPLKYATDDIHADGTLNPDGDSMATILKSMNLVTVVGDRGSEYFCFDGTWNYTLETDYETAHEGTLFTVGSQAYLTTRDVAANSFVNDDGATCLKGGFGPKNTWVCEKDAMGRYVRGASAASFKCGTVIAEVIPAATYYDRHLAGQGDGFWYVAYPYQGGYARGQASSEAEVFGRIAISADENATSVRLLHYQVYQEKGFNPYTGWFHPPTIDPQAVDTTGYSNMDEFLSMVFWHRAGQVSEADMQVTPDHSRVWIWQHYSTHPKAADSDGDSMPDGWEFYLMAGPTGDAGPGSVYSPLYDFRQISSEAVRDNDPDGDYIGDGLEWPEEYSGCSLDGWAGPSARYGWEPVNPLWRNKTAPTDPWNFDTDNDGIWDGTEGGEWDKAHDPQHWYQNQVNASCFFNVAGKAGGGLNPTSMDTDLDGLPDPWELEFHGSWSSTESATASVQNPTGSNTVTSIVGNRAVWNMDGMNPTVADERLDYDGDGLANWQEYLTGTMRCWRYDDIVSGWVAQSATFEDLPTPGTDEWDQYWYDRLLDTTNENGNYNPHLVNGYFDPGIYMTHCSNTWDPAYRAFGDVYYYFKDGVNHDIVGTTEAKIIASRDMPTYEYRDAPNHYISTDPREVDSDGDGMDDFYEIFHGLNPLLGKPGVTKATTEGPFNACDLVYDAYARKVESPGGGGPYPSATDNWWYNDVTPHETRPGSGIKHPIVTEDDEVGGYDFVAHPWLNGLVGADPDGDNIVNQEEAILPNVQAALTYHHSDPTPLWMTDTAYTNSLTRLYYRCEPAEGDEITALNTFTKAAGETTFRDPYTGEEHSLDEFECFTPLVGGDYVSFVYANNFFGVINGRLWSYEENEGYDSDHDFLSDYEEGQGRMKNASDMQVHDDPIRRQAMYFNGTDAFLQTPVAEAEETVGARANPEARQNFLYYTVECWAKADTVSLAKDGKVRTLVERAIYTDNASPADETRMRRNFHIGLKDGRWYTCFDSSGTDKQPVEITDGPFATTNWTHVAATYDGTALRLYVNGKCTGTRKTSIQPEHGVLALSVSQAGEMNPEGYSTFSSQYCISILVGASARNKGGLVFDSAWRMRSYKYADEQNPEGLYPKAATLDNYACFYKGYIDEVRIWDGARDALDIEQDCENRVRYTFALAEANRQAVYDAWRFGGLRSPASEIQLPPQLMYHWAFDHIAGAVLPEDVAKVPSGFSTDGRVLNARAKWSRPADYTARQWATAAVRSTVYTDNAWVPWINNTVSHLPRFDLTTIDSMYWSEDYAGYVPAGNAGYESYRFPRNAEVNSRWLQLVYGSIGYYDSHCDMFFDFYNGFTTFYPGLSSVVQDTRWHAIAGYDPDYELTEEVYKLRFAARDRNVCGDDILPMGGAYPRRISELEGGMWDDATASDAWAETGNDADNNGFPDWWEEYARENYCPELDPSVPLAWDTPVTYDGETMPAYEAYLRDLAKGLVKIGGDIRYRDEYADRHDSDSDSMPDWWEDLYGIDTHSPTDAKADADNDQLSNLIEYLISSMDDFQSLNPSKMATRGAEGQVVPDYFLRHGSLYLGEMFADHDMIEDWWEDAEAAELAPGDQRLANVSRFTYDANRDADNDGWNSWQEARASIDMGTHDVLDHVITNDVVKLIAGTSTQLELIRAQYAARFANVQLGNTNGATASAAVTTTIRYTEYIDVSNTVPNYTGRPIPEVPLALAYNGLRGALEGQTIVIKAWSQERAYDPTLQGEADAAWVFTADDTHPFNFSTNLAVATKGYLRSGRNVFAAYAASAATTTTNNKNNTTTTATEIPAYVPGQPYGVVTDVKVDYLRTAPFTIEMTDVNAATARINLPAAIAAQTAAAATFTGFNESEDLETILIDVANYFTYGTNELSGISKQYIDTLESASRAVGANADRGANERTWAKLSCPREIGTNMTFTASNVLVRIYRTRVNDQAGMSYIDRAGIAQYYTFASEPVQFEATFNLGSHPYLTEADLLAAGILDLDWGTVTSAFDASGLKGLYGDDVVSADYRIVIGDGTGHSWTNNNILAAMIHNCYEAGSEPTPAADLAFTAYGSQPTFFWTHANTIGKEYPAFQLIVKDGKTVIYDSGARPAPARNAKGQYVFTAPIWPGMMTASGTAVQADKDYTWQVSMLDAKFSTFPASAASGTFRIRNAGDLNNYGSVHVTVKYMGPGTVATSGTKNLIRVEAYTSPDFSGAPYGVGYVDRTKNEAGEEILASSNHLERTATVTGLLKGRDYYLRAFLDTDGDGERADWESWGYANFVDTPSNNVYTARAVRVPDEARIPTCTIYVEDADTNNNQLPDVWEWNKDGCLGGKSTKGFATASPYIITIDGKNVASKSILWTAEKTGASELPYLKMLTLSTSGATVPTTSLALMIAGVDPDTLETEPEVRISSFSLTDGLTLDIDLHGTTEDGAPLALKTSSVQFQVSLTLQLQRTEELGGGWTDVGAPVTRVFPVSGTTTVSVSDIDAQIRAIAGEQTAGAGYFRVKISSEVIKTDK